MRLEAICSGELVSIETVPDVVFSDKMMGDGFAFIPTSNRIVSPVSGAVQFLYPGGHAIGLLTEDNVKVLIHFGLGSYQLPQGVINSHVSAGEIVKIGQVLLDFDLEYFYKHNINPITPVVFTSGEKVNIINIPRTVKEGDILNGLVD